MSSEIGKESLAELIEKAKAILEQQGYIVPRVYTERNKLGKLVEVGAGKQLGKLLTSGSVTVGGKTYKIVNTTTSTFGREADE